MTLKCDCSPPMPSTDVDNRSVFCSGPLLDRVQRSSLFPESRDFVDMSCIYSPGQTLADYEMFSNCTRNDGSLEYLQMFVEKHFNPPGSELEPWTPTDWKPQPSCLSRVSDPELKQFAAEINELWKQLGRRIKDDVQQNPDLYSIIYVPNPFIVPDSNSREYSYWGSFWIIRGLLQCGMHQTARGMIENFLELVQQYGCVPACGRIYCAERTQPPLLIMMMKAYVEVTKDEQFAFQSLPILEREFENYVSQRSIEVKGRTMYQYRSVSSLPGPRPEAYKEDLAAAEKIEDEEARERFYTELKSASESGQEFSSRWFVSGKCASTDGNLSHTKPSAIVPVELNAIIFRSGKILAEFNRKAGNARKAEEYQDRSCVLVKAIRDILWNSQAGIWLDYDVEKNQSRNHFCCTNFAPLWARAFPLIDTDKVSKGVMDHIKSNKLDDLFGGVPHTLNKKSGEKWDYPNVFPPMMFMVVEGLDNLGTKASKAMSRRWAHRWVKSNYDAFKTQGVMFEKYFCEEFGSSGGPTPTGTAGCNGGNVSPVGTPKCGSITETPNGATSAKGPVSNGWCNECPPEQAVGYGWSNAVIIEFLCKFGREISMTDEDDKACQCRAGKKKDSYVITSQASMETNAFRPTTSMDKKKSCICGDLISKTTAAIGTQSSAFRPASGSKNIDQRLCLGLQHNKSPGTQSAATAGPSAGNCGSQQDGCSCGARTQVDPKCSPDHACCCCCHGDRKRCRHQDVPACSCAISRTQMVPIQLECAEHYPDCPCNVDKREKKPKKEKEPKPKPCKCPKEEPCCKCDQKGKKNNNKKDEICKCPPKDSKDSKDSKSKESKESKEPKERKERKERNESRESRESKDPKEKDSTCECSSKSKDRKKQKSDQESEADSGAEERQKKGKKQKQRQKDYESEADSDAEERQKKGKKQKQRQKDCESEADSGAEERQKKRQKGQREEDSDCPPKPKSQNRSQEDEPQTAAERQKQREKEREKMLGHYAPLADTSLDDDCEKAAEVLKKKSVKCCDCSEGDANDGYECGERNASRRQDTDNESGVSSAQVSVAQSKTTDDCWDTDAESTGREKSSRKAKQNKRDQDDDCGCSDAESMGAQPAYQDNYAYSCDCSDYAQYPQKEKKPDKPVRQRHPDDCECSDTESTKGKEKKSKSGNKKKPADDSDSESPKGKEKKSKPAKQKKPDDECGCSDTESTKSKEKKSKPAKQKKSADDSDSDSAKSKKSKQAKQKKTDDDCGCSDTESTKSKEKKSKPAKQKKPDDECGCSDTESTKSKEKKSKPANKKKRDDDSDSDSAKSKEKKSKQAKQKKTDDECGCSDTESTKSKEKKSKPAKSSSKQKGDDCSCSEAETSGDKKKGKEGKEGKQSKEAKKGKDEQSKSSKSQPKQETEYEDCACCGKVKRQKSPKPSKSPKKTSSCCEVHCVRGRGKQALPYSPMDQNINAKDCACFVRDIGADDIWCGPCEGKPGAQGTTTHSRWDQDKEQGGAQPSSTIVCPHCGGAYSASNATPSCSMQTVCKNKKDNCDCAHVHTRGMSHIGLQKGCCKGCPQEKPKDDCWCGTTSKGMSTLGRHKSYNEMDKKIPDCECHQDPCSCPQKTYDIPCYGPDPVPSGRASPVSTGKTGKCCGGKQGSPEQNQESAKQSQGSAGQKQESPKQRQASPEKNQGEKSGGKCGPCQTKEAAKFSSGTPPRHNKQFPLKDILSTDEFCTAKDVIMAKGKKSKCCICDVKDAPKKDEPKPEDPK